ncbi:hypothetical protein RHSP_55759 [Rhizobium freirei PRF 81]|uniref:Uncharacterized protein n=1 Tax=Rhizobium freirei PRF 81 TaxID=363754 RepID=N6V250_9HYPH|nr:hypothetical protein [Rhizobium freirei]ENN85187.1 hypothetical protein RHSP_55759 [Rhizobium freirei PRF 81]
MLAGKQRLLADGVMRDRRRQVDDEADLRIGKHLIERNGFDADGMGLAGAKIDAAEIGAIAELACRALDELDGLPIDLGAFLQGPADCRDGKAKSCRNCPQGDPLPRLAPQTAPYRQSLHFRQIIPLRHVGASMPAGV